MVIPFGLCNSPTTFQRAVLSIFVELVHDVVEIYMDDFTPYGCDFQEALSNLCKVLKKCIEMNMSLSPKKCEFLMTAGTMLGHSISHQGLRVDPNIIPTSSIHGPHFISLNPHQFHHFTRKLPQAC